MALDAEAMVTCQTLIQDTVRTLRNQGASYRWTTIELNERFGRRLSNDPDVLVYFGSALEFMGESGEWVRAFYECDWNTETGEVVDVRARQM